MRQRVLAAVVGLTATTAVWAWATDAGWAKAAGLDVWNTARPMDPHLTQEERARALADGFVDVRTRSQLNEQLTREVASGGRPLAEAAQVFWDLNRDAPGFAAWLERAFTGPTPVARTAQLLVHRVGEQAGVSADERARSLARLREEYAATFGRPAPTRLGGPPRVT